MSKLKAEDKPFEISKWLVWDAYKKVKANKGAPGVDGQAIEQFEQDLENNLYRLWNRLSSGTYFPPPVKAVEIPKPGGRGIRVLGIPTDLAYDEVRQVACGFGVVVPGRDASVSPVGRSAAAGVVRAPR